ncbi:hypothetical protein LJC37_05850, partial [Bacteroidales bacterium OttesenSCG-928-E04]|nr:hypothetical protein [Bacteroidales bacterium OttesenSCG-928-E04]
YCIFLIIIGFIGITTFIGIVFLLGGIAGLFLREYIVVLANEKGDFPLVKGKKMKMKKIVKRIEQAKSDTGDEI